MAKFSKKMTVIDAWRWFRNGDLPDDNSVPISQERPTLLSEGEVVRYFYYQHPNVPYNTRCSVDGCRYLMEEHGWIDASEGGHTVCPGDFVIREVKGEFYPCKSDIFEATYEPVEKQCQQTP